MSGSNKIHLQVKWCAQVFPDPVLIACDLLTETLTGLDPPLTSYIDTYIDSNAAGSPVEALINIRKVLRTSIFVVFLWVV